MNLNLQEEVNTLRNWLDQIETRFILLKQVRRIEILCYSKATKSLDYKEMKRSAFNYLKVTYQIRALKQAWKMANQEHKQAVANFNRMMAKAC